MQTAETIIAPDTLKSFCIEKLEDLKAENIIDFNVADITTISDYIIVASGTSRQHVKSLASHLIQQAKKSDICILGVEGEDTAEWVLIDLGDAVIHIMLPETREYYALEKLWSVDACNLA